MRRQTGVIFVLCVVCPFPVQRACPHYTILYDTAGTSLKRTSSYQSFSSERLVLPVFLYTSYYYVHSNLAASGNGISCCWQSSISCGRHHLSISTRGQCTSPDSMECAKSPVTVCTHKAGRNLMCTHTALCILQIVSWCCQNHTTDVFQPDRRSQVDPRELQASFTSRKQSFGVVQHASFYCSSLRSNL